MIYIFDYEGNQYTCNDNFKLHSYDDQPAVIRRGKTKLWYKDGQLHRDNVLPAIVWGNGTMSWYKDGVKYVPHFN